MRFMPNLPWEGLATEPTVLQVILFLFQASWRHALMFAEVYSQRTVDTVANPCSRNADSVANPSQEQRTQLLSCLVDSKNLHEVFTP
jgi:hypothetical protein